MALTEDQIKRLQEYATVAAGPLRQIVGTAATVDIDALREFGQEAWAILATAKDSEEIPNPLVAGKGGSVPGAWPTLTVKDLKAIVMSLYTLDQQKQADQPMLNRFLGVNARG